MSDREFLCNPLYYVEIMRHKYTDTLCDWCCVELSHVLDFSGTDGLGQVLMGNVDVRQGKTIIRKFTRHKKKVTSQPQLSVFGAALNEDGYIQARKLIEFLNNYVHLEGLFRIPGNSSRQGRLKEAINQRRVIDLESSEFTPHDVACVLKTFLSELPEPLLTDRHYEAHVQAAELTYKLEILPHHTPEMLGRLRATRTTSQVTALRHLFLMLQPPAYKLLRDLMALLHTVAANEDRNKMNASSLGILLAPHILWPRFLTADDLRNHTFINKLNYAVEFMISYCNSIFKVPEIMLKKCEIYVKNGGKMPEDEAERMECLRRAKSVEELDCGRKLPIGLPEQPTVSVQNTRSHTEEALAQLYANVQAMPESSKKRKLMKQFQQNSYLPGTPTKVRDDAMHSARSSFQQRKKHRRSRSAGDVIIKSLGTPFNSKKKRLAPNPPPQRFSSSSSSDDLNDLNNENRRRANTLESPPTRSAHRTQEMNIPTPAPRTPISQHLRQLATPAGAMPGNSRSSPRFRQGATPTTIINSTATTTPVKRAVLKPQTDNITPTRRAPTAPPKKYSPYIPPPKSHSSPKELEGEANKQKPTRPTLPPPRSHSSPKEGAARPLPQARRTPVPAPRTSTPPVSSVPRKRRSDGKPVEEYGVSSTLVGDSWHSGSARRPIAKPRIADKRPALQTAV